LTRPDWSTNATAEVTIARRGAVALPVGAIEVANIMVTSVLERRSEIGLRRALVLQPDFVTCGERALDTERPPLDDHGL
jgi:hypothetical protein